MTSDLHGHFGATSAVIFMETASIYAITIQHGSVLFACSFGERLYGAVAIELTLIQRREGRGAMPSVTSLVNHMSVFMFRSVEGLNMYC